MNPSHLLFEGAELLAAGELLVVALAFKRQLMRRQREDLRAENNPGTLLVFETRSGRQMDIDIRGDEAALIERYGAGEAAADASTMEVVCESPPKRQRGRPKLGVVGREVTLLPRHWAWLDEQPGGASNTLRRLIERERTSNQHQDLVRRSQNRTHGFLSAIAGDLPGFEEAIRALYAGDRQRFTAAGQAWPSDIGYYACRFAEQAFLREADTGDAVL
ncbi:DUF2239 family protein [Exilibacterium tricleocarpae]|nr:DUF2239 family protein [Exilibacterium tricleocarpae]